MRSRVNSRYVVSVSRKSEHHCPISGGPERGAAPTRSDQLSPVASSPFSRKRVLPSNEISVSTSEIRPVSGSFQNVRSRSPSITYPASAIEAEICVTRPSGWNSRMLPTPSFVRSADSHCPISAAPGAGVGVGAGFASRAKVMTTESNMAARRYPSRRGMSPHAARA